MSSSTFRTIPISSQRLSQNSSDQELVCEQWKITKVESKGICPQISQESIYVARKCDNATRKSVVASRPRYCKSVGLE